MTRKPDPDANRGALTDRIHRAVSRLHALSQAWERCYPMLWDTDQPPPEANVTTSSDDPLPVNPDNPPRLHRAYTASAKHVVRAARQLADVTGRDPWRSTLLDTPNPIPPHHQVARVGTLNVAETLTRVEPDALTAADAQAIEHACDEADKAVHELTRVAKELVYQRGCRVAGCRRRNEANRTTCRQHRSDRASAA